MAIRLTRDLLAVIVTSVFLGWVIVTFFGLSLFLTYIDPQLYIDAQGWMRLAALDVLVAVSCAIAYVLGRTRIPATTRAQTR